MLHPLPSLATTAAGVAFALVLGSSLSLPRLLVVAFTILMNQFSISALNDWADRDRDRAAQRRRPVAMQRIPARIALVLAIVFGLATVPAMFAFGPAAGVVLAVGLLSGWGYDLWLKPTVLSFLPFAVAFPLLPTWVGLAGGRSLQLFGWLFVAGAILATGIHLADSLPDIDDDARAGVRNLAVRLGHEGTVRAISGCLLAGGAVVVGALASRPATTILMAGTAFLGAALVAANRGQPQRARWIVGGYAAVAAIALVAKIAHG